MLGRLQGLLALKVQWAQLGLLALPPLPRTPMEQPSRLLKVRQPCTQKKLPISLSCRNCCCLLPHSSSCIAVMFKGVQCGAGQLLHDDRKLSLHLHVCCSICFAHCAAGRGALYQGPICLTFSNFTHIHMLMVIDFRSVFCVLLHQWSQSFLFLAGKKGCFACFGGNSTQE